MLGIYSQLSHLTSTGVSTGVPVLQELRLSVNNLSHRAYKWLKCDMNWDPNASDFLH